MGRRYSASDSSRGRRQALLRNQISDLILNGFLVTTEPRAKTLKSGAEQLISRTKQLSLVQRRRVLAFLPKESAAEKLFEQIIPQFKDRVGGYVRVVKLSPRSGDNAPMARVEFVEKVAESTQKEERGATQKEGKSAAVKAEKQAKRSGVKEEPKVKGRSGKK